MVVKNGYPEWLALVAVSLVNFDPTSRSPGKRCPVSPIVFVGWEGSTTKID